MLTAVFMKPALAARISETESDPICPHTCGVFIPMELITGKKSAMPCGTEQLRTAVPPKNPPARNHTESRWPTIQFTPVESNIGLTAGGIESAHCHHWAVRSFKSGPSACARVAGINSPAPMAIIEYQIRLYMFLASPCEWLVTPEGVP